MTPPKMKHNWNAVRETVLERDRGRCANCLASVDQGAILDVDHGVPRGAGGSDRLSNLNTLCRRCHKAKHGEGIAPTVEISSTGTMTDIEFYWYRHLMGEMLPAMALNWGVRLIPKFGIGENQAYYIPLGDLRLLDQRLLAEEADYVSYQIEQYM